MRVACHPTERLGAGCKLPGDQDAAAEALGRVGGSLRGVDPEHYATGPALVRWPVELDDDREAELSGRSSRLVRRGRALPGREGHAVALQHEARFVLGQRALGDQQAVERDRPGPLPFVDPGGTPADDARERAHSRARAAEQGQVEPARELLDPTGWVGTVHGGDGGEDRAAGGRVRQAPDDRLDPSLLGLTSELGEVDLSEQDVERTRRGHQLERAREHPLGGVDGPRVERVAGREVVRKLDRKCPGERFRKRLERQAGRLAAIGQESSLAAGLGDSSDPSAGRPPRAAQHLERLDQLGEVVDLQHAIAAQQRREGPVGADESAGVRQDGACRGGRTADLEADDRFLRDRAARKRLGEGGRSAHRLEEECDDAGPGVVGQEGDEVRGVGHGLATRRDDAAEADAATQAEERLADRARLADRRDVSRSNGVRDSAEPGGRPVRAGDAHAVRTQHGRTDGPRASSEPLGDRSRRGPGLTAEPGDHERPHACCGRLLERPLDSLVVDDEKRRLRELGKVDHPWMTGQPEHVPPRRVYAPGGNAAAKHALDDLRPSRRGSHDDEGAREEERTYAVKAAAPAHAPQLPDV